MSIPQSHELHGHTKSSGNTECAKNYPCSLGNGHILFLVDKPHTLCKMQFSFKWPEILTCQLNEGEKK